MSLEYSRRYNGGAGFEPLRSVAVSSHVAANNLESWMAVRSSSGHLGSPIGLSVVRRGCKGKLVMLRKLEEYNR